MNTLKNAWSPSKVLVRTVEHKSDGSNISQPELVQTTIENYNMMASIGQGQKVQYDGLIPHSIEAFPDMPVTADVYM